MATARFQVLLAALCFATTGTAQALGPDGTDPVGVGAARILVGGTLLVALVLLRGSGFRARPWARGPVLAAVGGVAVYQLAFFAAVADTGVAVGTIVALGSAPTLAGLFEWVLDRRRPSARWTVATALACAGVVLLALAGGEASVSLPGVALAVTAGGGVRHLHALGQAPAAGGSRARDGDGRRLRARRPRAPPGTGRQRARLADARRRRRARALPRRDPDRARLRALRARAASG